MRILINRRSSTKPERIFYEILKLNHIPFRHRVEIEGREIDFILGNYAVEIDGHSQSSLRNAWIISRGYIPVHYGNNALLTNRRVVEADIVSKYGLYSKSDSFSSAKRKSS